MTALRAARVFTAVVLAGACLVGALVAILQGPDQLVPAWQAFVEGVAGTPTAWSSTISKLTPILLIGVAATLAFRAGLFDVGQIGQYVSGATVAGIVAPYVPGPGPFVALVTLVAAVVAGALWSVVTALLAGVSGLDLIVLSLVANYLADGLAKLLVRTTFQDPDSYSVIATKRVPEEAWLPTLVEQTSLHGGAFVAAAVFLLAVLVFARGTWGHRLRMYGLNPDAAALAGVPAQRFTLHVLATAGGVCGLAGGVQVLGVFHRYQDGAFGGSGSIAWTGLTAAILVPAGVAMVLPMATLLAVLSSGFVGIQRDLGITAGLGALLQGVVIIAAAVAMRAPASDTTVRSRRRGDASVPAPSHSVEEGTRSG